MLNRRTVLTAMAGLAASGPSLAAESSPLAHGALAQNPLALAFESSRSDLPGVLIAGRNGVRPISTLLGRTLIMPLWAEWCPPCMSEMPDFARLQQKFGSDRFAVVPVLTGTHKKITPDVIAQMFSLLHADVFEPLMEQRQGKALLEAMARRGSILSLPCNLVIAPNGTVVGREFGLKPNETTPQSQNNGHELLSRAQAGDSLSLWGRQPGEELAQALANGFLG